MANVGDSQEFTFKTADGKFYQGALTAINAKDCAPSLSRIPKMSRDNVESFYSEIPMNGSGGNKEQFAELLNTAQSQGGEIVEIFVHLGPRLVSMGDIQAVGRGIAVVTETP